MPDTTVQCPELTPPGQKCFFFNKFTGENLQGGLNKKPLFSGSNIGVPCTILPYFAHVTNLNKKDAYRCLQMLTVQLYIMD